MDIDVLNAVLWLVTAVPGLIYVWRLIQRKQSAICKVSVRIVLLLLAIFVFFLISVPATRIWIQNKAVVTGVVYDQANNTLAGASLNLADSPPPPVSSYCVEWSGTGGWFTLCAPKPGTYFINVQKENYVSKSIEYSLTSGIHKFNIHLSRRPEVTHEQVVEVEVEKEQLQEPEIRAQIERVSTSYFGPPDSKAPTIIVEMAFSNTGDNELVWKATDSWLWAQTKDGRVIKLPFDYESTLFLDSPLQGYEIEVAPGAVLSGYISFSLPEGETLENLARIIGPSLAYEVEPTGVGALLPSWINPPTEIRLNP